MIKLSKVQLQEVFARLRSIAATRGTTTKDIAEALEVTPHSNVSRWATGSGGRQPPLEVVRWLATQVERSVLIMPDRILIVPTVAARVLAGYDGVEVKAPPEVNEEGEPEAEVVPPGLDEQGRFIRQTFLQLPDPGSKGCLVDPSAPTAWADLVNERWKTPGLSKSKSQLGAAVRGSDRTALAGAVDHGLRTVVPFGNLFISCTMEDLLASSREEWWKVRQPVAAFVGPGSSLGTTPALVWWIKGQRTINNELRLIFV